MRVKGVMRLAQVEQAATHGAIVLLITTELK
jgi:hypothetical protein